MKKYIFLKHTADIKFQAFGKNVEEVFENSASAMFTSIYDGKIKGKREIEIKVSGKDFESLLYNFLEELLFLFDSENFFVSKISKIKIDKKNLNLSAKVSGDDAKNYEIHLDIKAVTYNDMFVKFDEEKKQWVTQVVLDV